MHADRKNNIIEIYSVLLTDCICGILSYIFALLFRYGMLGEEHHRDTYVLVCVWILLFTVLYNTLVGSGRNFLRRGYFVEMKSVIKQLACLFVFLVCSLFFFKEAENFSRLLFAYYMIIYGLVLFVGHALLKKYCVQVTGRIKDIQK